MHSPPARAPPAALRVGRRPQLLPWPKVDFAKFGEIEAKPLSRIKKISGANLARNWAMIPHVTQHDDADITEMEAFRKKLGEENKDLKVTPLVFLIKAVVAALKTVPALQRLARRRQPGPEEVLPHRHRGGHARRPGGAGDPRLRQEGPARAGARTGRDLEEGARQEARPGRDAGRLLLDQLARRHRRHRLHADRQRAGSGDPRRVQIGDEAGVERQGVRAATDAAVVAVLRPSRDRRRPRRALHRLPRAQLGDLRRLLL